MKRRSFLKSFSAAGAAVFASPSKRLFSNPNAAYFDLHPFIKAHPEAVFIKYTGLSTDFSTYLSDTAGRRQAGYNLATDIFVPSSTSGVPTTNRVIIKPNMTGYWGRCGSSIPSDGIVTLQ